MLWFVQFCNYFVSVSCGLSKEFFIQIQNMPSSQSRLAQLIRDVSDHRVAIPRLSGSEPLELLLEIGLEKMNKNYEYIFMESKLCTADGLRADKRYTESATLLDGQYSFKLSNFCSLD